MIFVLGVWYSDVPLTDGEAAEMYTKLCDRQTILSGKSGAVEAFYRELTARWPEINTIPTERDDVDYCPWSCALDRSGMHVIMSCVWSKANDVGGFVDELSFKHGLVLFDRQHGKVHLPPNLQPQ